MFYCECLRNKAEMLAIELPSLQSRIMMKHRPDAFAVERSVYQSNVTMLHAAHVLLQLACFPNIEFVFYVVLLKITCVQDINRMDNPLYTT